MSRPIDADALEKEGWSLHRTIRIDWHTLEYQVKPIAKVPTINSELKWILCSERLPEKDGEYLILYYTRSKYKPYVYDVMSFANDLYKIDDFDFYNKKGKRGWFYHDREYGFCEDIDVYAWMPLPEPYREEGEQNG